ncbi:IS1634 family transposase [Paraglaciecola sp. MB-3u-78]|uniref:IS1634 family transposase n=1 Tax=Paraglaciecola sp. MB-3u-78 TaxID=2058332 RepID=UPI0012FF3488|nr:IS1634 family transposase [Paraglaciecola sp. MB-3u-78]
MLQAEFIKQKEKNEVVQVETLDHLGIVAGLVDKLKLVERIDARVPISKKHGAIVTHGQSIKAMIINGLGFTQNPIYLSPTFFEGKDVCALMGEGIEAQHLNDDVHGRTLAAIYKYGTTALLAEMANEISQEFIPATGRQNGHLDTSSLKVCGDYAVEHLYPDDTNRPPLPRHGHSKDHRPDLKQLVISLTTSGPAQLPIWYEGLDGNSSDKANFHQTLARIKAFRDKLENTPEFLWVCDSALYSQDKLRQSALLWLTRVPENLGLVKQLVQADENDYAWQNVQDGYKGLLIGQNDRGLKQRWLLVHSAQAEKRGSITLEKRIEKSLKKAEKSATQPSRQAFGCEQDTLRTAKTFEKTLSYHRMNYHITKVLKYKGRGRPKSTDEPVFSHYKLEAEFEACIDKIRPQRNKLGRFILASNDLDNPDMNEANMLSTYKEQQGVERGFRFIKDPLFHLSGVFLKKPERIDALMMVMTLCLMVYNAGQYQVRKELEEQEESILSQVGKPTKQPTLRWIFQKMSGIHRVHIPGRDSCISGLNEEKEKIIRLFGPEVCRVYKLA